MEDGGVRNNFPRKVNFDRYKKQTPPIIPYVFRYCMDEIVDRTQCELIRAHPSALKCLIGSAQNAVENESDMVLELLNFIIATKKDKDKDIDRRFENLEKEDEIHRILLFQKCHSHIVLAAVFEFIKRIEGGLAITVEYPSNGWLILGPPFLNPEYDAKKCDLKFSQEVEDFVLRLGGKGQKYFVHDVQRDMFVYLMTCLTKVVSITADCFRTKPVVSAITRRTVANVFAPLMLTVKCDCGKNAEQKNCKKCTQLCDLILKPPNVAVMENMFTHIPFHFWQDYLDNPRPKTLPHESGPRNSMLQYLSLAKSFSSASIINENDINLNVQHKKSKKKSGSKHKKE